MWEIFWAELQDAFSRLLSWHIPSVMQYKTIGMGKIFHPGAASGNDDIKYSWSLPYFHCMWGHSKQHLRWSPYHSVIHEHMLVLGACCVYEVGGVPKHLCMLCVVPQQCHWLNKSVERLIGRMVKTCTNLTATVTWRSQLDSFCQKGLSTCLQKQLEVEVQSLAKQFSSTKRYTPNWFTSCSLLMQ